MNNVIYLKKLARQKIRGAFATAAVLVVLLVVFTLASFWITSALAELREQRRAEDRLQAEWLAHGVAAQLAHTWQAAAPPEISAQESPFPLPLAPELAAQWTITVRRSPAIATPSLILIHVLRNGPAPTAVGYQLEWTAPSR